MIDKAIPKYGLIPPHFIFYLKSKNIEIENFFSTRKDFPNLSNSMIVSFPLSNKKLLFKVSFTNILDKTDCPDISIINEEELSIDNYSKIVSNLWKFEDSSSLFNILNELKTIISQKNLSKIIQGQGKLNRSIMIQFDQIIKFITTRHSSYSFINPFIDFSFSSDEIIISYPLDYKFISSNTDHNIIVTIALTSSSSSSKIYLTIPLNYLDKFQEATSSITCQIGSTEDSLIKYERKIYSLLKQYREREALFNLLIEMKIGFIIDIDKMNYLKGTFYISSNSNTSNGRICFFLIVTYKQDSNQQIEVSLINCFKLQLIKKKLLSYSNDDQFKIDIIQFLLNIKDS